MHSSTSSPIARRNLFPPRPPTLQPIRPSRSLLSLAARLPAHFAHPSRHPFPRTQKSFQQRRHIKVRIQPRKMNAETRRAQLNLRQVRSVRVLQSLRVLRPEAHCDLGAKLNHNPTARAIVMRGDRPWKSLLQLPRSPVRKLKVVTPCHEFPPMLCKAFPNSRSTLAQCARVPARKIRSSPGSLPARADSSDQKPPRAPYRSRGRVADGDRSDKPPPASRQISEPTAQKHRIIFPKRLGYSGSRLLITITLCPRSQTPRSIPRNNHPHCWQCQPLSKLFDKR
jgi:hypothetical protein